MKSSDELYQETLDREIERQAKEQGLTVEDLLIMLEEEKAQKRQAEEQSKADSYWENMLDNQIIDFI